MNDILATFKILFDCLVVNDWHVVADGYAIAAGTRWARLYFVAFHILSVLVVMNIVIAFILEAFIMQWNVSQSVEKCAAAARGVVRGGAAALMRRPHPARRDELTARIEYLGIIDDNEYVSMPLSSLFCQKVDLPQQARRAFPAADESLHTLLVTCACLRRGRAAAQREAGGGHGVHGPADHNDRVHPQGALLQRADRTACTDVTHANADSLTTNM
ncbi:MAG: ion transporter [Hydrogenophaga sp.]|uniref:hypothetical protein n=1 Tax=Hydrogenophaga sp. TaxID=1904254 RepID=UPI00260BEECF|nr:hypothetical protein [Hydrogenophaga sp.]MCW5672571.1 ion transporter [Hydrogenophaga sp.]